MNTVIRKIGNSSGAIIPSELLKSLNLKIGDGITISEERNKLVIRKVQGRPVYSLNELLAACDDQAPYPEELGEWDAMMPAGDEAL